MINKMSLMLLAAGGATEAVEGVANYGKNVATWGLEQIFWIVLLVGLAAAAFAFIKKNWVGALITMAAVAIVCYFIKNPTKLSELGETLGKIIGL